jgi:hypothetical protein
MQECADAHDEHDSSHHSTERVDPSNRLVHPHTSKAISATIRTTVSMAPVGCNNRMSSTNKVARGTLGHGEATGLSIAHRPRHRTINHIARPHRSNSLAMRGLVHSGTSMSFLCRTKVEHF